MNDYIVDLLVEAILEDICRDTSEWADPTAEKAIEINEISNKKGRS